MDAELVERLRRASRSSGGKALVDEAADALEAALAREAELREALKHTALYTNRRGREIADAVLTAHPPLERSEAPSTLHSTLCALNATGHRGPCTCGAGSE